MSSQVLFEKAFYGDKKNVGNTKEPLWSKYVVHVPERLTRIGDFIEAGKPKRKVLKSGSAALETVEKRLKAIKKQVGDVDARLRASHLSRAQTGRIPNLYDALLSQELCKSPENIDAVVMERLKKKEKRANEEKRKAAEESFRNWVESKKERESQLEEELAGTKTHTGQKSPQKSKESGNQVWREWKEEKDRQDKLKLRKIKEEQLRWQKEQLEAKMKMIERAREIQERTRKRQELIARQRGLRLHASAVFPKSAKRKFGSGSVRVLGSTSLSSQGSSKLHSMRSIKLSALEDSVYKQHLPRSREFALAREKQKKSPKRGRRKKGKRRERRGKEAGDATGGSKGPAVSTSASTPNLGTYAREPSTPPKPQREKSKKLKLNMGVASQSIGDTQALWQLFELVDSDKDGIITKDDWVRSAKTEEFVARTAKVRSLWLLLRVETYATRMKALKGEKGGDILTWPELREFVFAMIFERGSENWYEELHDIFALIDTRRDGKITKKEWLKAVSWGPARDMLSAVPALEPILKVSRLKSQLAQMDTDEDGRVSWSEFRRFVERATKRRDTSKDEQMEDDLHDVFVEADSDFDGTVTQDEWITIFASSRGRALVEDHEAILALTTRKFWESRFAQFGPAQRFFSWDEVRDFTLNEISATATPAMQSGDAPELDDIEKQAQEAADAAMAAFAQAKLR